MTTQADWDAKFEEIAAEIGRSLFGDALLTQAHRSEARVAANEAIDDWEMAQNASVAALPADTTLQRLLTEQHELAERLLDIQDTELPEADREAGSNGK